MPLDEILQRNRAFSASPGTHEAAGESAPKVLVVACHDPRLDGFLLAALGLGPGQAVALRAGGALVRPGGDLLRSIALATLDFDIRDVLVVGHSTCRMASFATDCFIDSFRRRGVAREAFGPQDLREWAGAVHDPRQNVQASVKAICETPFLPRDLSVSGLLLDDATGALSVVVEPAKPVGVAAGPVEVGARSPAEPGPAAETEAAEATAQPRPPDPILDLIRTLESKAGLRDEWRRVRAEISRQENPLQRLRALQKFILKASEDSKEVEAAVEKVMLEAKSAGRSLSPEAVLELIHRHLVGGKP